MNAWLVVTNLGELSVRNQCPLNFLTINSLFHDRTSLHFCPSSQKKGCGVSGSQVYFCCFVWPCSRFSLEGIEDVLILLFTDQHNFFFSSLTLFTSPLLIFSSSPFLFFIYVSPSLLFIISLFGLLPGLERLPWRQKQIWCRDEKWIIPSGEAVCMCVFAWLST